MYSVIIVQHVSIWGEVWEHCIHQDSVGIKEESLYLSLGQQEVEIAWTIIN